MKAQKDKMQNQLNYCYDQICKLKALSDKQNTEIVYITTKILPLSFKKEQEAKAEAKAATEALAKRPEQAEESKAEPESSSVDLEKLETKLITKDVIIKEHISTIDKLKKKIKELSSSEDKGPAMLPTASIMASLSSALKGQTEAIKKEKELKYLDDMIKLKEEKLKTDGAKKKNKMKSGFKF